MKTALTSSGCIACCLSFFLRTHLHAVNSPMHCNVSGKLMPCMDRFGEVHCIAGSRQQSMEANFCRYKMLLLSESVRLYRHVSVWMWKEGLVVVGIIRPPPPRSYYLFIYDFRSFIPVSQYTLQYFAEVVIQLSCTVLTHFINMTYSCHIDRLNAISRNAPGVPGTVLCCCPSVHMYIVVQPCVNWPFLIFFLHAYLCSWYKACRP